GVECPAAVIQHFMTHDARLSPAPNDGSLHTRDSHTITYEAIRRRLAAEVFRYCRVTFAIQSPVARQDRNLFAMHLGAHATCISTAPTPPRDDCVCSGDGGGARCHLRQRR